MNDSPARSSESARNAQATRLLIRASESLVRSYTRAWKTRI